MLDKIAKADDGPAASEDSVSIASDIVSDSEVVVAGRTPAGGRPLSQRLSDIADRALTTVSRRIPISRRNPNPDLVTVLAKAATRSDRDLQCATTDLLQVECLAPQTLVDCYIPAAARLLGDDWCTDRRSFVEVTIGSSRLQSLVRELSAGWQDDRTRFSIGPTVAMVVQHDEFHTLGAMVAASQLRRLGASVQLVLGHSDCGVAEMLDNCTVDLIAISSSSSDRLESVRNLIEIVRMRIASVPPIVIGGALRGDPNEARTFTGADHCVSDPCEALRLCGLVPCDGNGTMAIPVR